MTILRGFKVDCLDVNLIPTKEVWRALRQNYAIHSSRENLSYKWQKTQNDPKLPLISFQPVLFWWWFIAVESMLEMVFLKWSSWKGVGGAGSCFSQWWHWQLPTFSTEELSSWQKSFRLFISMGKAEKTNPAWTDFETKIPWNFEEIFRL